MQVKMPHEEDYSCIDAFANEDASAIAFHRVASAVNHWRPQELEHPRKLYKLEYRNSGQRKRRLTHSNLQCRREECHWQRLRYVEAEEGEEIEFLPFGVRCV